MSNPSIEKAIAASSLRFVRTRRGEVQMKALFRYGSLVYRLETTITRSLEVDAIRHSLSTRGGVVFDAVGLPSARVMRGECQFGAATTGTRSLTTLSRSVADGMTIEGFADGAPLVPMVFPDCGCHDTQSSLLTWNADRSASPVAVMLKASVPAGDFAALAEVARGTIARANDGRFAGSFAGLIGCIDLAVCMAMCAIAVFVCVELVVRLGDGHLLPLCPSQILTCWGNCIAKAGGPA
jgi:hypothetical protein